MIDALDECIDKRGLLIWNDLLSDLKNSASNIRLLYTSRNIDDTAGILLGSTVIEICADGADIKTYAQGQLQKSVLLQFCRNDPDLQNNILQAVVS